ncbi:hypothetical protein M0811_05853 [Anaeramoeba ignava]|uniref:Uncharacterized protein n=1 Tax=Anaeramoeba ignava TaxID=1746090 RepID=A0A9Q0LPH8_ANAIG|nr:hypothetical protein M0811_05853 [Anaeramoeba ignava]|eukprot:Anaeramoba_ignava/a221020_81.p1 GENE.a221020_81~~a221020_81.p1  ORF type:complete len:188 (-),score=35.44 a221020_81:26-589(-)
MAIRYLWGYISLICSILLTIISMSTPYLWTEVFSSIDTQVYCGNFGCICKGCTGDYSWKLSDWKDADKTVYRALTVNITFELTGAIILIVALIFLLLPFKKISYWLTLIGGFVITFSLICFLAIFESSMYFINLQKTEQVSFAAWNYSVSVGLELAAIVCALFCFYVVRLENLYSRKDIKFVKSLLN